MLPLVAEFGSFSVDHSGAVLALMGDAVESGINYKTAGTFSVDNADELSFMGGFFGGKWEKELEDAGRRAGVAEAERRALDCARLVDSREQP